MNPFAFITSFGLVSMFMDIVYEGALAVQGPLLLSLGASAALVGIISGLGEATSLAGRLVSGPAADKSGKYWTFAIAGYAITALAVPAMGFAGSVVAVSALIIIERLGKSVRTPSRDAMLAHASSAVGRGKGFALHEALDQVGAITGPLIVAAILSYTGENYAHALGVLLIPGAIAIAILCVLRHKAPNPELFEKKQDLQAQAKASNAAKKASAVVQSGAEGQSSAAEQQVTEEPTKYSSLPKTFWAYAAICGICLSGVATFAVMSFHAVSVGVLSAAQVPIVYAVAMAVDAVAALITGNLYDRIGPKTLLALPVTSALIPWFAYGETFATIIAGAVIWGLATGVQESTMRAYVADLVPSNKRATSYGIFSLFTGVGTLLGGTIAGTLYATLGTGAIIAWASIVQIVVFVVMIAVMKKTRCS
jgi:MFS family permease